MRWSLCGFAGEFGVDRAVLAVGFVVVVFALLFVLLVDGIFVVVVLAVLLLQSRQAGVWELASKPLTTAITAPGGTGQGGGGVGVQGQHADPAALRHHSRVAAD